MRVIEDDTIIDLHYSVTSLLGRGTVRDMELEKWLALGKQLGDNPFDEELALGYTSDSDWLEDVNFSGSWGVLQLQPAPPPGSNVSLVFSELLVACDEARLSGVAARWGDLETLLRSLQLVQLKRFIVVLVAFRSSLKVNITAGTSPTRQSKMQDVARTVEVVRALALATTFDFCQPASRSRASQPEPEVNHRGLQVRVEGKPVTLPLSVPTENDGKYSDYERIAQHYCFHDVPLTKEVFQSLLAIASVEGAWNFCNPKRTWAAVMAQNSP